MEFDEYLQQQLLAIEQLEDRKIMRKIFESVLVPLQEYCDEQYVSLAEKIINEKNDSARYTIYTGLIQRQKYDVTTEDMLPMKKEDLQERKIDLTWLKSQLSEGQQAKLFPIYLQFDRTTINELIQSGFTFHGTVKTDAGEYPARFCLCRNEEYLHMVQELYPVFLKNGVEWKTVCAPYLYKFADVYVAEIEELQGEEIEEISIDFQEYKDGVAYDLIPLWNLEIVTQNSSGYARPCVDQIHYEHEIFKERLGEGQYLVLNPEVEILNQRRVKGDLLITCNVSGSIRWNLLKFHVVKENKYGYPVMGNGCMEEEKKIIRTKAAMEKFISNLGYESRLKLVEISTEQTVLWEVPVYHVDEECLEDYMFTFTPGEKRNVLSVVFHGGDSQDIYLEEILSYLITRLQWAYPEYICIGKLQ